MTVKMPPLYKSAEDICLSPSASKERIIELEKCLNTLREYARWQIVEGCSYHPTLPSILAKADAIYPVEACVSNFIKRSPQLGAISNAAHHGAQ